MKFYRNHYILLSTFTSFILLFVFSCKEPALQFKTVVINRDMVDSIFKLDNASKIIFQTTNQTIDRQSRKRNRYRLVAFISKDYQYIPLPENFFESRTVSPVFKPIKILKDGVNENFGNLILSYNSIPTSLSPKLRFVILDPGLLEGYQQYVKYKMYVAKTPNETISTPQDSLVSESVRTIAPIKAELNPSPPK